MRAFNLITILLICTLGLHAEPVTKSKASVVAANFYTKSLATETATPQLAYTATVKNNGDEITCFRIYNIGSGFVIVSADDRVKPILGYSRENNFDPDNMPDGVRALFESYKNEMKFYKKQYNKLLKLRNKCVHTQKKYIATDEELEERKKTLKGNYKLQRFKGLGEMNADELYDTTMSPKNRRLIRVTLDDATLAEKRIHTLMGDEVAPRKAWINENVDFTLEDDFRK